MNLLLRHQLSLNHVKFLNRQHHVDIVTANACDVIFYRKG